MANSHDLFLNFNSQIKLSDSSKEMLKMARNSLRERVESGFKKLTLDVRKTHSLEFQSQGSFVMDTIIKPPYTDDFDLDDGIYFLGGIPEEKRPDPKVFHNLVIKSIDKNSDIEEITDKSTCVRVKYYKPNGEERGFHIDLPIYYKTNTDIPDLADKENDWIESSPVEFIAWFEEKTNSNFQKSFLLESAKYSEPYDKWFSDIRKNDCQLRRLVRYLKLWVALKRTEMPSGIMMTIMVTNNFIENVRDDIALRNVLVGIYNELNINGFKCFRPTPKINEDLFAPFSKEQKIYFRNSLESFINSANNAINNPNKLVSCHD